jgi:predicted CXXCH cytochrome family protein
VAKGSGKRRRGQKTRQNARPAAPPDTPRQPQATKRKRVLRVLVGIGLLLVMVAGGFYWTTRSNIPAQPRQAAEQSFVGSQACSGCHQTEAKLWQNSQHRLAMDHATEQSVRGDFNNASFEYAGTRSRFFREGKKFLVETDGSDGKLATFEIKYTFGVDPLQQYLIEFPDGRVQALSIAWDTRPKEQGGQRWFHLYPNEAITHDDPLHWTRLNQNWNFTCAECHSTDVRKNYDAAADRFATSFSEISVGCEACHGAGSRHVAWARSNGKLDDPAKGLVVGFDERANVTWSENLGTLRLTRSRPPALLRKEVETCGLCHSRRGQLSEAWKPGQWLSETHRVTTLNRALFHADGQMRDDEETYNYAPFKQSRMYAMGVTCSDCHDPHSAALRASRDGVCAQCHAPARYETVAHRHHEAVTPNLGCSSCHMPERRYMVVDRRHDHGFRVPRPDLSLKLGTPNACNDCHSDKPVEWAAAAVDKWFGPQRDGFQTYAGAFHAVWADEPDAQKLLTVVASSGDNPPFARASALAELPAPDIALARQQLSDPDPMVRLGVLDMLEGLPAEQLWPIAAPRLTDPVRGVRIRAAELLAAVPSTQRRASDRDKFANAAAEFVAAQELNADRPDARTALGNFLARNGEPAQAEAQYRAALRLDPGFSAAAINLSDLYRELARDSDGEKVLRETLARSQRDPALHYALGLNLTRLRRAEAALDELKAASQLAPEQVHYAYVYAVALQSAGRRNDAMAILKSTLQRHPFHRELLTAATTFSRDAGDRSAALDFAERLAHIMPDDPAVRRLVEDLRK